MIRDPLTFEMRNVFLYTDIHVDLLLLMMQSLKIIKSVECLEAKVPQNETKHCTNTLFCLQVRIDHRTKAVSFGLDLHVAHKEEVPEGPYLQV